MPNSHSRKLQIWCFLDDKPGHQNQTLGLVDALNRNTGHQLEVHSLSVPTSLMARIFARPHANWVPETSPHLLIGAGHATHLPMLRARRRYGGHSVVLMKPSLPLVCFDYCVIPDAHRLTPKSDHILITQGVLNRVQFSSQRSPHRTLVLLGGPSPHFQWNDDVVLDQLKEALQVKRSEPWIVATSRRTPPSMIDAIKGAKLNLNLVHHQDVSRDWLPAQMQTAETIWVTEDSVSMTYEAITSGAAVGIFQLPRHRVTRSTRGMDRLIDGGLVTPFARWQVTKEIAPAGAQLREADRTAHAILNRFYPMYLNLPNAVA